MVCLLYTNQLNTTPSVERRCSETAG